MAPGWSRNRFKDGLEMYLNQVYFKRAPGVEALAAISAKSARRDAEGICARQPVEGAVEAVACPRSEGRRRSRPARAGLSLSRPRR